MSKANAVPKVFSAFKMAVRRRLGNAGRTLGTRLRENREASWKWGKRNFISFPAFFAYSVACWERRLGTEGHLVQFAEELYNFIKLMFFIIQSDCFEKGLLEIFFSLYFNARMISVHSRSPFPSSEAANLSVGTNNKDRSLVLTKESRPVGTRYENKFWVRSK